LAFWGQLSWECVQVEQVSVGNQAEESGPDSQRRDERDSLFLLAKLAPEGHTGLSGVVRVRNVSSGGLMADAPEDYPPGTRVQITLEGIGLVLGAVAWAEAGRVGIAFDHPIDKTRARKAVAKKDDDGLFRPTASDHKRPSLKPK
jgi:hypothetical protein